jgi:hypothetical protein
VSFALAALVIAPVLAGSAGAQQSSPALVVVPLSLVATGPQGGPFSPPSFQYRLSATSGTIKYSIDAPSWVTPSPSAGTIDTRGAVVTLTINPTAQRLQPGTYGPAVRFTNGTNGRGSASRAIRLIVLAPKSATTGVGLTDNRGWYLLGDQEERLLTDRGEPLLAR